MKTITMDYDLYIEELKEAKKKGFKVVPNLKNTLNKTIKVFINSYSSSEEVYRARNELIHILDQLDEV